MKKIKIYLCARISPDAHSWNNTVCNELDKFVYIFKPQDHNPYNISHREFQPEVYEMDLKAMEDSDMGLLLVPYGRDCAWEVGWYSHSKKPIVAYVEAKNGTEWLRDWMLKGGLTAVITPDKSMYEVLQKDHILGGKCVLIRSRDRLSDALISILNKIRGDENG